MLSEIKNLSGRTTHADLQNIRGKVAVITGGSGASGTAIAQQLLRWGAYVCITAGNEQELDAALAELVKRDEVFSFACDLSREGAVKQLFDAVQERFGGVDILVNNTPGLNSAGDGEASRNLCTQEAIVRMQAKGAGRIVHINDRAVQYKNPSTASASSATRARSLAAALRRQANELGIRVTSIEQDGQEFGFEDVARCVVESLVQPYSIDVVYLNSQASVQ